MFKEISACRICGNTNLIRVLSLGEQTLTGVFPKIKDTTITKGPLTLIKCTGDDSCGLLQLSHSYSLDEMYGKSYGYRSGLNPSMIEHLNSKVDKIKNFGVIEKGDIIVDIGSNDATTLKQYDLSDCTLVGIDPTGIKFKKYYSSNIDLIPEFFSSDTFKKKYGNRKAKVITSFAMFYDLEEPIAFMREIADILCYNGIWIFEQSYMPLMLSTNSYDTVCHEHLEYYSLSQVLWMAKRSGLKIIDVEINDINGGSFSVTAQKIGGDLETTTTVKDIITLESEQKLDDIETYRKFSYRVQETRKALLYFLEDAKLAGRTVSAIGASTKGNVILQYCGIDSSMVNCIGEINPDKFGTYTPGTFIPIVDEKEVISSKPDYVLVLPWHFKKYFQIQNRFNSLKLVYPLPELSFE